MKAATYLSAVPVTISVHLEFILVGLSPLPGGGNVSSWCIVTLMMVQVRTDEWPEDPIDSKRQQLTRLAGKSLFSLSSVFCRQPLRFFPQPLSYLLNSPLPIHFSSSMAPRDKSLTLFSVLNFHPSFLFFILLYFLPSIFSAFICCFSPSLPFSCLPRSL